MTIIDIYPDVIPVYLVYLISMVKGAKKRKKRYHLDD